MNKKTKILGGLWVVFTGLMIAPMSQAQSSDAALAQQCHSGSFFQSNRDLCLPYCNTPNVFYNNVTACCMMGAAYIQEPLAQGCRR